jgi:hypothetical protein
MIKGLTQSGKYTVVTGGNTSMPYVNQNANNPIQGMIRIWGNDMQVFDGSSWLNMSTSYASVGLTQEADELLDWARKKRQEEVNLKMRMAEHPGLKDAYEKFKIMDALTLEEEKHGQEA